MGRDIIVADLPYSKSKSTTNRFVASAERFVVVDLLSELLSISNSQTAFSHA